MSLAAQAAENDKRKKVVAQTTIERVKANHLARQLQMRLQYARLKVEHGWQKQNLNEVENLYFHNSHLRGPKPFVSLPPPPTIITTQPSPERSQPLAPPAAQAPLNFEPSGVYSHTPIVSFPVTGGAHNASPSAQSSPIPPSTTAPKQSVSVTPNALSRPESSSSSAQLNTDGVQMIVDPQISSPSASQIEVTSTPDASSPTHLSIPPTSIPSTPSTSAISTVPSSDTASPQTSTSSPSSTNHYPSLKAPRSRTYKHPGGPKGTHQNLTAKDIVNFSTSTTSSLTYDSFWSSHAHSQAGGTIPTGIRPSNASPIATTGRQPSGAAQTVASGIAELASAFHNSGVFVNGLPDFSRLANVSSQFGVGNTSGAASAVAANLDSKT